MASLAPYTNVKLDALLLRIMIAAFDELPNPAAINEALGFIVTDLYVWVTVKKSTVLLVGARSLCGTV